HKHISGIRFDFTENAGVIFIGSNLRLARIGVLEFYKTAYSALRTEYRFLPSLKTRLVNIATGIFRHPHELIKMINGYTWGSLNYNRWIEAFDSYSYEDINFFIETQKNWNYS